MGGTKGLQSSRTRGLTRAPRPLTPPPRPPLCAVQVPGEPALQGAVPHWLAEQGAGQRLQVSHLR